MKLSRAQLIQRIMSGNSAPIRQKLEPVIWDRRQAMASASQSEPPASARIGRRSDGLRCRKLSACPGASGAAHSRLTGAAKCRATATASRGLGLREKYKTAVMKGCEPEFAGGLTLELSGRC